MSKSFDGWMRAVAGGALTATCFLFSVGVGIGAEGSGLSGGGSSLKKGSGGRSGGGGGKRMGEGSPIAPALPAPGSSVGDDTELQRKARRLQFAQSPVEEQQAFMRTLRAHFVPGTWKPDQIADPSDRSTLLHYAVLKGYPEAVRYLLDQGANPVLRNLAGTTPLGLARDLRQDEIIRMLEQAAAAREAAKPAGGPSR